MKIEGPGKVQNTGKSKKPSKTDADGLFGQYMESEGAQSSKEADSMAKINQTESLLSVQAAENPTEKASKQRMRQRAEQILDMLEDMRHNLLTGRLTVGQLLAIADVVASYREKISDPKLTVILDDIDLRAQVEIAKLSMALEKQVK